MWHYPMCRHYPMCCPMLPCFPILMQSSLHLVIFKHTYLTHTESDFRNLKCYEFSTSFSSHLPFRFPHEGKKSCLQSLRKFHGVTSSSRYPLVEIIFYENQDGICFLWDLGFWILTIQPSHSYTLAYCRPIHLISIEFQNIENNQGSLPKKKFLPLRLLSSCNPWGHFDWDLFYKILA
jgi:hypothetical protein